MKNSMPNKILFIVKKLKCCFYNQCFPYNFTKKKTKKKHKKLSKGPNTEQETASRTDELL